MKKMCGFLLPLSKFAANKIIFIYKRNENKNYDLIMANQ
jgi:hypothetical protein